MGESYIGIKRQQEARWPLLCLTTYWRSQFAGCSGLALTRVKHRWFFSLREGFVHDKHQVLDKTMSMGSLMTLTAPIAHSFLYIWSYNAVSRVSATRPA